MFDRFIPAPGCLCILQVLGSVERPLAFTLGKTSAFLILVDDYLSRRTGLTKIRKRPVFYATTSGSESNYSSSSLPWKRYRRPPTQSLVELPRSWRRPSTTNGRPYRIRCLPQGTSFSELTLPYK